MIGMGKAGFWEDGEVRIYSGGFDSLPDDGALWIILRKFGLTHVLLGADGYWVDGNQYGMTFEDAHPKYGGLLYAAWDWSTGGSAQMMSPWSAAPPPLIRVVRGIELPNEVWAAVVLEYLPEISGVG